MRQSRRVSFPLVHHLAVDKKDSGPPVPVRPDERAPGDPARVEIMLDWPARHMTVGVETA